jgi:C4-dicarboxylate-specific signal transduction histidine kinase
VALQLERLRERMFQRETARNAKERETAVARADSVGQFASSVSREVFAPLSVAAVNVRFLAEMVESGSIGAHQAEITEVTRDLRQAVERMHNVVVAMQSFVSADARPLEVVRLSDVVQEALAAVPNPHRISVEVGVKTDERAVARRELLEKVMDVLLDNAIGAVADVPNPRVVVRVYRHAGEPRISVRDNGPPITSEIKDRIFQPFFQPRAAHRKNIGLAVCREFVARMGGALTLAPGDEGACFRIRLRSA